MRQNKSFQQFGFSLLELIIAMSVFVLLASVISTLVYTSYSTTQQAGDFIDAELFAQEGIEAARSIRDEDWGNLTSGDHGLLQQGGKWTFSGSGEFINNKYLRVITVSDVTTTTRDVLSTVTWQGINKSASSSIVLTTQLTDWGSAISENVVTVDVGDSANGVWVEGNTLFLVTQDRDKSIMSFDVSNPLAPVLLDTLDMNSEGWDVDVNGNYAYVSLTSTQKVAVVDISNPSNMSQVATISLGSEPRGLEIYNNYLYLSRQHPQYGIYVYSIANPTSPSYAGRYRTNTPVFDIKIAPPYIIYSLNAGRKFDITSNYAHVAVAIPTGGFETYTIPSIVLQETIDVSGEGREVFVLGSRAYAAAASPSNGVAVIDISDEPDPVLEHQIDIGGGGNGVFVKDGYIFVAADKFDAGLAITPIP